MANAATTMPPSAVTPPPTLPASVTYNVPCTLRLLTEPSIHASSSTSDWPPVTVPRAWSRWRTVPRAAAIPPPNQAVPPTSHTLEELKPPFAATPAPSSKPPSCVPRVLSKPSVRSSLLAASVVQEHTDQRKLTWAKVPVQLGPASVLTITGAPPPGQEGVPTSSLITGTQ